MIEIDMKMPSCCDDCFALDDYGCMISGESCGHSFKSFESRMPSCPMKDAEPRMDQTQQSKPPLGVKPYWMAAWSRISDLAEAIERQYEDENGNTELVELWAKEIILQCRIFNQLKEEREHDER